MASLARWRKGRGFGMRVAHAAGSSHVANHADASSPEATRMASWRSPGMDENASTRNAAAVVAALNKIPRRSRAHTALSSRSGEAKW